jgi:DNA-binding NarL/FixJ family response regulator
LRLMTSPIDLALSLPGLKGNADGPMLIRMGKDARPTDKTIRVVIVDDHPLVRDVIRFACEKRPRIEVVAESGDGADAIDACRRVEPDVLVVDLGLPTIDGLEVARRVRRQQPSIRILVLSGREEDASVFEAVRAGANGYLRKAAQIDEIPDAIEAVASGRNTFTASQEATAHAQLAQFARKARDAARTNASLTGREREVVRFIAQGLSTRQMATRMNVSERTVETHISNVYNKLRVRTRVEVLHRAAGLGLVDLG